ncbi:MAG: hypothetical protein C4576_26560 [Desulfobacteraceae bacterium]|nr:MAG: hypothetical protein C4576_26560 [Desulfobacteraceae bacterium]
MYFSWIILVACTIWFALLGFFWALHNGQFTDQNRARYLPFGEDFQEAGNERISWKGRERFLYLGMAVLLLFFFGAAAFVSLRAVP